MSLIRVIGMYVSGMGVLYDYFSAPDDAAAAAVIDRAGGPGAPEAASPNRGGLFRWRVDQSTLPVPGLAIADTGIDPVVQCATLEELLTGRPYEVIETDPRWGQTLAIRDGGERLILTLTDDLVDALARADPADLARVAGPWAQTEEFGGQGDPDVLKSFLTDFSAAAREARSEGRTLYCWVCV